MVRFKFFLFALLVLGLGLAHLPLVSGPLSARATEGAAAPTTAAISEVARSLESRRLAVQGLALKLAASPEVATAVQPQVVPLPRGKGIRIVEPPTDERFAGLRAAAGPLVPEALKDSVVLALATHEGSLYARVDGEPASDGTLDVQEVLKAGSEGAVVEAFDAPHVFFSVPVLWNPEGGRSRVAATLVVGASLVDEKALASAALSSGVAALALVRGDKLLGSSGAQKELAAQALKALRAGQLGHVVQRGSMRGLLAQLPQVKLPLLTHLEDFRGGQAPLAVGSRRALEEGFEVVAVASVRPFMSALADYQQNALFGLGGLLGFSLMWMLVMGSGRSASAEAPAGKEKKKKKGQEDTSGAEAAASAPEAVAPLPASPVQEPPVPSPDDFPFPATPAASAPAASAPPVSATAPFGVTSGREAFPFPSTPASGADPYATQALAGETFPFPPASPFEEPGVARASPPGGAFSAEEQPTAAYSLQQAADPYSAAAPKAEGAVLGSGEDSPPETTRVAAIPQELLRAARLTGEVPVPPSRSASASEEQHFQEVFREFVATREQCGEPNDGLTYDKFMAKLRKNKEQLVQKYACKTVRFQVYVKEGKAALKATPVKD